LKFPDKICENFAYTFLGNSSEFIYYIVNQQQSDIGSDSSKPSLLSLPTWSESMTCLKGQGIIPIFGSLENNKDDEEFLESTFHKGQ